MDNKPYNGWANYATWCVNLWLENDEGWYHHWRIAAECALEEAAENPGSGLRGTDLRAEREATAAASLAERMKDELEDAAPDLGGTVWSDLLTSALADVSWYDIALAWVEGLDD